MLSSNQRKLILQLDKKKHRLANKLFVAEGKKVVNELINLAKNEADYQNLLRYISQPHSGRYYYNPCLA